ncbi:MAG: AIPR family protein [Ruminococcus sp.]|nr:AIPR family protein [Ruminococcus sp.]
MAKFQMIAKSFKKMDDPVYQDSNRVKYVCYVRANTIPKGFDNWMGTNPREQKMTTNVAQKIINSLEENSNFHELNRGILMSAENVTFDNKTNIVDIELNDVNIHGNIDGGHTLRAILNLNSTQLLPDDRYVFMEIFTGIDSPVELAAARNTSVQVDLKSIEELQKSFDVIKAALSAMKFSNRIAYKMNEHYNDDIIAIDVREIIAIMLMFSQDVYPFKKTDGTLSDIQPVQCYTGKESSLKKFINLDKASREKMIYDMSDILPDIYNLWEKLEVNFSRYAREAGKNLKSRKVIKSGNDFISNSLFYETEMDYIVPRGMLYPVVGAFRALVRVDEKNGKYYWQTDPITLADKIASKLIGIVLDEKNDNPDAIGKNSNLWSNLFKEIYIIGYLQ